MSLFSSIRRLFQPAGRPASTSGTRGSSAGAEPEIPLLTAIQLDLQAGHYDEAVCRAYQTALRDVIDACHLDFPLGWTNEEILDRGFSEHEKVRAKLRRMYDVYAPIRFGPPDPGRIQHPIEDLVVYLYADWDLYLRSRNDRGSSPTAAAPTQSVEAT